MCFGEENHGKGNGKGVFRIAARYHESGVFLACLVNKWFQDSERFPKYHP